MSDSSKSAFERDGYTVARQLFPAPDVARYRDHCMAMRRRGRYPHELVGADPGARDPLRRYPRTAHMHRWDEPACTGCLTNG